MTTIWVAPVSAMESFVLSLKMVPAKAGAGEEMLLLWEEQVLDATTVILSSLICWVGFNKEAALTLYNLLLFLATTIFAALTCHMADGSLVLCLYWVQHGWPKSIYW